MTANGRSAVRRRQRRRSKKQRLYALTGRISRLPLARRIRIVARIEDALFELEGP